jgi:hypothetical protein
MSDVDFLLYTKLHQICVDGTIKNGDNDMNREALAKELVVLAKSLTSSGGYSRQEAEELDRHYQRKWRDDAHKAWGSALQAFDVIDRGILELQKSAKAMSYDFDKGDFDRSSEQKMRKLIDQASKSLADLQGYMRNYKERNLE